jgi:hypothetical protein
MLARGGAAIVGDDSTGGRAHKRHARSHVASAVAAGETDPIWALISLAMSFFFFTAAASHMLFLTEGSPVLAPMAYGFSGLLSLYELFGANSILGWDTSLQALAHGIRDMLLAAFVALIGIELAAIFPMLGSDRDTVASVRLFWAWRDMVGFALSVFWLLSLRVEWRVVHVAGVLVCLLGLYAGSVLASSQVM